MTPVTFSGKVETDGGNEASAPNLSSYPSLFLEHIWDATEAERWGLCQALLPIYALPPMKPTTR
jgi:hypothetical protein